jgi:hypothetical protein
VLMARGYRGGVTLISGLVFAGPLGRCSGLVTLCA